MHSSRPLSRYTGKSTAALWFCRHRPSRNTTCGTMEQFHQLNGYTSYSRLSSTQTETIRNIQTTRIWANYFVHCWAVCFNFRGVTGKLCWNLWSGFYITMFSVQKDHSGNGNISTMISGCWKVVASKLYIWPAIYIFSPIINPLNAELNPICHFLSLLGAHHIFYVSRIRVNRGKSVPLQAWRCPEGSR